jgi:hypothetical protein
LVDLCYATAANMTEVPIPIDAGRTKLRCPGDGLGPQHDMHPRDRVTAGDQPEIRLDEGHHTGDPLLFRDGRLDAAAVQLVDDVVEPLDQRGFCAEQVSDQCVAVARTFAYGSE